MDPVVKQIDYYAYDPRKQPIGSGSFAKVFKGTDQRNDRPVAIKVIPIDKLVENDEEYKLFTREIEVLRNIKGEHVVRLFDCKRTANNLYLITEYCDGGDLDKRIKDKHSFKEEEVCSILNQMVDAFLTIEDSSVTKDGHKVSLMHRDIKPANILYHQGKIKIADFGFAKTVEDKDKAGKHTIGLRTPLYMSPELLKEEPYSLKCDIWATGMLTYQLLFGKLPWNGNSINNLCLNIQKQPLVFPKEISPDMKDLLTRMLKLKDEERITWREVSRHPALAKVHIKEQPVSGLQSNDIKEETPQMDIETKEVLQDSSSKKSYLAKFISALILIVTQLASFGSKKEESK